MLMVQEFHMPPEFSGIEITAAQQRVCLLHNYYGDCIYMSAMFKL